MYEFKCDPCESRHELVRPAAESSFPAPCPACGIEMRRIYSRTHLIGTKVQEKYFNHALGAVGTDSEHRARAKAMGMIEVGNETPGKHLKVKVDDYSDINLNLGSVTTT